MRQTRERRTESRSPWLGLLVAVVVALAGFVVGVGADVPAAAAATSCSGPLEPGQIRVVVVVDPGDGGGSASSTCLVVAEDGTQNMGSRVLAQRAAQLGRAAPRYAGSGLLCGLDGFPGSGCPQNNGGSYDYWAYFNPSGGGWAYGSDNPFSRRMHDGEIMGWRYNAGSAESQAAPPRIAPSASLFPPLAQPPPPPATSPPAAGGTGSSGSGSGAGSSGSTGGAGSIAAPGDSTTDPAPTDPSAPGATDSTVPDTTTSDATDENGDSLELAADPTSSSSSDGGRWIGVVVVVVTIGALGAGAVLRSRTRS